MMVLRVMIVKELASIVYRSVALSSSSSLRLDSANTSKSVLVRSNSNDWQVWLLKAISLRVVNGRSAFRKLTVRYCPLTLVLMRCASLKLSSGMDTSGNVLTALPKLRLM
jgi:hypothetical protein